MHDAAELTRALALDTRLIGINKSAAGGLIATLANNIAMFEIMKNMDKRGKILNAAFAVSAAFVLGDHLGFTAGVARDMIAPMRAGKLRAGVPAILVAYLLFATAVPAVATDADAEPGVGVATRGDASDAAGA